MLKAARSILTLILMITFLSTAQAQDSTPPKPYTTISLFELTAAWLLNLYFSEELYGPEAPLKVTVCQLKSNPGAYNHKLIEVAGFISHGFEDFTLFDPDCSS